MNRRGFLKLLGGALVVAPLAAKIVVKGTACGPTVRPETIALASGEINEFMGFRFIKTDLAPKNAGIFATQAQLDALLAGVEPISVEYFNEVFRMINKTPDVKWVSLERPRTTQRSRRIARKARVRPQFSCL